MDTQHALAFWRWLTTPPAIITSEIERASVRLFLRMLVAVIALLALVLLVFAVVFPLETVHALVAAALIGTLISYGLGRSRHYATGINLVIAVTFLTAYIWTHTHDISFGGVTLLIPILIFSQFYDNLRSGLFAVFCVSALLMVPHEPRSTHFIAVTYVGMMAYFIIGVAGLRREAEDRLRQQNAALALSEERFRQMTGSAPDGIQLVDEQGTVVAWNAALARIIGIATDAAVGQPIWSIQAHIFKARVDAALLQAQFHSIIDWVRVHDNLSEYDHVIVRSDGAVRTISVAQFPVRTADGMLLCAFVHDVTEARAAEQSLVQSEARLRALLDSTDISFVLVDRDHCITLANQLAVRRTKAITGKDVLPGTDLHELIIPAMADEFMALFEATLAGEPQTTQIEHQYPDGSPLHMLFRLTPVYIADRIIGVCIANEHITERVEAERALRESQSRLQLALDAGDLGLWDWQVQTDETYFNDQWALMLGYEPHEISHVGKDWEKLVHPDDLPKVHAALHAHLDGQTSVYETEHRLLTRSGQWKWILDRARVVERAEDGTPLRMTGTHTDITELKQAAQNTLDLTMERERSRLLRDFIQNVSHEFRTPLATIESSLYLLERGQKVDPLRINQIRTQAQEILWLVENLTKMVSLQSMVTLQLEPVEIGNVLDSIVDRYRPRKLDFVVTIEPALPYLLGDPEELTIAFRHIVDNAVRHTPAGGTITVRASAHGGMIRVLIRDTGVGISHDALPHIFETFYRTDQAHTERGMGLGLAIARRIVEIHGGTILADSTPGQGSTFTITLPVRRLPTMTE